MSWPRFIIAAALAGLLVPLSAIAGEFSEEKERKKEASGYFSRGEVLFEAGEYSKAAEAFNLAYETFQHPATLINIAMSYERAKWLPKAVEAYRRYLAVAAGAPDERKIKKRLKHVLNSVGELSITCRQEGCQVEVDGRQLGSSQVVVVVDPGTHQVSAIIGGIPLHTIEVAVDAGESQDVDLFGPQSGSTSVEPSNWGHEVVRKKTISLSVPFWIAAGLTAAAGATTIVFGVRALNNQERFIDSGRTDTQFSDDGRRDQIITNVFIGVTSAAAIVAASFAIRDVWFSKGREGVQVSLGPGPNVGLTGTF